MLPRPRPRSSAARLTKRYGIGRGAGRPGPGGPGRQRIRLPGSERRRQDDHAAHPGLAWPGRCRLGARRGPGGGRRRAEPARALIGYLDQDPRFYGWMTPRDLLGLVGKLHAHGMGAPSASRIDATLATVGLADAARRSIGGFSGGMRQRLGLAQAILNRPPVLLLDEPVSSLDPQGRHDMLETIRGLGGEATVLVLDPHPHRRGARLRSGGDHRPRTDRHRRPDGRAAGPLRDADLRGRDRAGRRAARSARWRLRCGRCPASPPSSRRTARCGSPWRSGDAGRPAAAGGPRRAGRDGHRLRAAAADPGGRLPAAGRPRRPRSGAHDGPGTAAAARSCWSSGAPDGCWWWPWSSWPSASCRHSWPDTPRSWSRRWPGTSTRSWCRLRPLRDAADQFLKNLGQAGILTAILLAMGSVANEKERGTAALILSKPASRGAFLGAKLVGDRADAGDQPGPRLDRVVVLHRDPVRAAAAPSAGWG